MSLVDEQPTSQPAPCPVLIAICTHDTARFTQFYDQTWILQKPAGSKITQVRGPSIARARNVACKAAIEAGAEYIFFLDDDQAFAPDLLMQLLKHNLPVVSGLYLSRRWPFHACAFGSWNERGQAYPFLLHSGIKGLQRIVATGCGALLIKTSLLKRLGEDMWFKVGSIEDDLVSEDFSFFEQVEKLGVLAYLDTEAIVGHMCSLAVWPMREGTQWMTVVDAGEAEGMPWPAAKELLEAKAQKLGRIVTL